MKRGRIWGRGQATNIYQLLLNESSARKTLLPKFWDCGKEEYQIFWRNMKPYLFGEKSMQGFLWVPFGICMSLAPFLNPFPPPLPNYNHPFSLILKNLTSPDYAFSFRGKAGKGRLWSLRTWRCRVFVDSRRNPFSLLQENTFRQPPPLLILLPKAINDLVLQQKRLPSPSWPWKPSINGVDPHAKRGGKGIKG